jgi:hypothetical protein
MKIKRLGINHWAVEDVFGEMAVRLSDLLVYGFMARRAPITRLVPGSAGVLSRALWLHFDAKRTPWTVME